MSTATATKIRPGDVEGRTPLAVNVLRSRAADLRLNATEVVPTLSTAYRRRAAELELEAAALAARIGLVEEVELAA